MPSVKFSADHDNLLRVAGGDDVRSVGRQDDLDFWATLNFSTQVSNQGVLKLRMKVCFRFFDDQSDMEGPVGKERVFGTFALCLCLAKAFFGRRQLRLFRAFIRGSIYH